MSALLLQTFCETGPSEQTCEDRNRQMFVTAPAVGGASDSECVIMTKSASWNK